MTTTTKPVILVIDDEPQMRRLLQLTLEAGGYVVRAAPTGNEGVVMAASERPELIILDLGLPDIDGADVLKKVREWSTVPVLILSVRNAETDIVGCLDAGANDYLVKPFRTGELLARVRVALRHNIGQPGKEDFDSHGLSVDLSGRTVKKNNDALR